MTAVCRFVLTGGLTISFSSAETVFRGANTAIETIQWPAPERRGAVLL